jgi:replicative DNA helicase
MVENALKAGQDKNIGHEYNLDIETRYKENNRKVIATPWPQVNDLLQGGLGSGDFGLIFGNPGGGKSWSLVALGGHAIRMGYNVLHYTLELGEDYVGRRYDAFFTQIPANNITQHREQIEEIVPQLPGKLIIKEFPMGKTSIHTVESHIRKCNDLNIKPDLIIIDYVDLLSSRKKNVDRKYEIDDIYTSTKGLARELNLPIWSVSQVNRAGAKDNVIEGDKSAGSYDKIMITDFCMSLSRKSKDKINGTGRFHIMKNRYGMDGMSYNVKADTSIGKFDIVSDYDEDDEIISNMPSSNPHSNLDIFDKTQLQKQFFNLNS